MKRALIILALLSVGLLACSQTGTGWYMERRKTNFRDTTYFTKSPNFLVPFRIGGTAVTSNAAELNILDGALTNYTELNYLVGVTSAIQTQLNAKQATLVSGTTLKTINGETLLGSGNIVLDSTGASMVYPGAGIPISTGAAWGTSITNNAAQWDSAYVRSLRWDGGAIGLNATTGRTSLGLGNVTNESKVTMFTSPTFTGTVSGITATMVGLGNVTNESKATMFTSPTFTGHPVIEGVTSTGATGTGRIVFSTSPTFTGTVTGTFSGNLTGNVTGTASLVTGFIRNSGTLTLSGGHGLTLTTTGTTGVTLPTSGTLVANPMTTAGDLIIGGTAGVPTRLAAGITGAEVMTTESITDAVIITVGDTTVTAVVGKIVYKTSDSHFYGCKATTGHKWFQLDN